jgi:hypothetical protein
MTRAVPAIRSNGVLTQQDSMVAVQNFGPGKVGKCAEAAKSRSGHRNMG